MRTALARRSPGTWSGVGAIVLCLATEALMLRIGIDDLDEGYFAEQAIRVLHGQVPYRDFSTLYTPGLAYLDAALFGIVGHPSLLDLRILGLFFRAVLVGMLFVLVRPHVRRPFLAALPGVLLLLAMDDAPVRWEPHPGWPSTVFAVLAAWCLTQARTRRWLLAAGLAAGLCYAFKQNTGLFIVGAIVAWALLRPNQPEVCLGTAKRTGNVSEAGSPVSRAGEMLWPLAGFATVTGVWLVPLAVAMQGDFRRLGVLVGAVNQAGLSSPPESGMIVPLACLVAGLWLARREGMSQVAWLTLAGGALLLTQYPRMDNLHLVWSVPLLLAVGAVALDRLSWRLVAVAACVVLAILWPTIADRAAYVQLSRAPIADVEAPTGTVADLSGVTREVVGRTRVGEPIFVYPSSPLIYVLADRPNPTRFEHLYPGAASASDVAQVIADLERADVRLVVVSDYWRAVWGPPDVDSAVLETWLDAHFVEQARSGAYRILSRVSSDL